ncbi:MAG: hypothetical protein GY711_07660 [bacterium]|nr:hypothetical protein [bacterium]
MQLDISCLLALAAFALSQDGLQEPSFEHVDLSDGLESWAQTSSSREAGHRLEIVAGNAADGEHFARLFYGGEGSPNANGNLIQKIDARHLRGQGLRVRAALRVEPGTLGTGMWLRIDRENGEVGVFHSPRENLVRAGSWTEVVIEDVVDTDARSLSLGFALFGGGAANIDDVRFEVVGPPPPYEPEPARPLSERGLTNLTAFARLLGYVRHFHPSDEAAAADWSSVAVAGVHAVEGARDADELARALTNLFQPLAPSVRLFATGTEPEAMPAPDHSTIEGRLYVRWWEHVGFGSSSGQYRSRRRRARIRDGVLPDEGPGSGAAFRADLGGGVTCLVPLAVFAQSSGSLPAPTAAGVSLPEPHPLADGDDRSTRLACAMLAWNLAQHFYPHFAVGGADWESELEVALSRAAADAGKGEFLITLRRLVAALADGHGRATCDALRPVWKLPLEWDWIEERVVITHVAADQAAGPAPGDAVVELDGRPIAEVLSERELATSGATPWFKRHAALASLRHGTDDSRRTLTVESFADGAERHFKLEPIRFSSPIPRARPDVVAELAPGLFYVDLDRIDDAGFKDALPRLARAEGVVFDLRGYPDHVHPLAVLPHLIEEPVLGDKFELPFITRPDLQSPGVKSAPAWSVTPKDPRVSARLAFLSGSTSISAAESWLSLVESNDLADIVGGPSAGTNGSASEHVLPGGYRVQWTGMCVVRRDGSGVQGIGIQPTVPVTRTIAGVATGHDEVLERALDLVRE